MKRIPSSIQVGGHTYEIVTIAAMPDNASVTHRLQRILINLESPESRRISGLMHEILHIVSDVYCAGRLSEDDVDGLGEGLFQVLLQFIPNLKIDWEVRSDIGRKGK